MVNARVVASGWHVPDEVLDNDFFVRQNPYRVYTGQGPDGTPIFREEAVTLTSEDIVKTTGVKTRRRVAPEENGVDLAVKAFERSGFPADKLSGIHVATVTHGNALTFPSAACRFQELLGARGVSFTEDVLTSSYLGQGPALDHASMRARETGRNYLVVVLGNRRGIPTYQKFDQRLLEDARSAVLIGPGGSRYARDISPEGLDGIIVSYSGNSCGSSAAEELKDRIGAQNANLVVNFGAACSGFSHALDYARLSVQRNRGYHLVVGVETLTRVNDYPKPTEGHLGERNCNLFGDGCGLVVLGPSPSEDYGILATAFGSHVFPEEGESAAPIDCIYSDRDGILRMPHGNAVFKRAVREMVEVAHRAMEKCGVTKERVDWFNPHQANGRIIGAVGRELGSEKVLYTVDRFGNMSSATEAVAYAVGREEGKIVPGNLVVWTDFASGFVSGSIVERV